jgi:hypothetical protein
LKTEFLNMNMEIDLTFQSEEISLLFIWRYSVLCICVLHMRTGYLKCLHTYGFQNSSGITEINVGRMVHIHHNFVKIN